MKRQIKMLISLTYLPCMLLWRGASSMLGRKAKPSLVILYYHAIPNRLADAFSRQMDWLNAHVPVVPASVAELPTGMTRAVSVTFDDAFETVVDNALPALERNGFHCTIFAPSAVLGKQPDWPMEGVGDRGEVVVDRSVLASLKGPLVTIGSHSVSHPKLSQIPRDKAKEEISVSRAVLTEIVGENVDLFAFPYGDHDDDVMRMCRDLGYLHAYTISPSIVQLDRCEFGRGRVSVNPDDSLLEFSLKAQGAYSWMPLFSSLKKKLLRRDPPSRGHTGASQ